MIDIADGVPRLNVLDHAAFLAEAGFGTAAVGGGLGGVHPADVQGVPAAEDEDWMLEEILRTVPYRILEGK